MSSNTWWFLKQKYSFKFWKSLTDSLKLLQNNLKKRKFHYIKILQKIIYVDHNDKIKNKRINII